jgi:hypothetical protein
MKPKESNVDDAAAQLQNKKQKKQLKSQGIVVFNEKPKKGIAFLQSVGLLSEDPAEIAHFLKQTEGLDYAMVGEYLSEPNDTCKQVHLSLPVCSIFWSLVCRPALCFEVQGLAQLAFRCFGPVV